MWSSRAVLRLLRLAELAGTQSSRQRPPDIVIASNEREYWQRSQNSLQGPVCTCQLSDLDFSRTALMFRRVNRLNTILAHEFTYSFISIMSTALLFIDV
jgi:hypothetical protein